MYGRAFLLLLLLAGDITGRCQQRPPAITTRAALNTTTATDPGKEMVPLRQVIPGILLDIRYATPNNFTGRPQYKKAAAYMRRRPAEALKKVQEELAKKGLCLKIYDAYRPYSVTVALWNATTDKRYVANPRRGSHHNRGIAADLTLADLRTGRELDMGTGFDNFTDSAHHAFAALPAQVLANRRLLKGLMWKHGFNFVPTEWWHYHWRDKNYEVLDIDLAELE
ncbi:M15 family metallopeptidase [Nemorincola caseinilytica]|uniref:D-alanyl-D-alanine dipeptidase n=1 Tax=Nemorincola caseinilytica TaxID=2054315 RepID=A0ABP8N8Z1_9BACT